MDGSTTTAPLLFFCRAPSVPIIGEISTHEDGDANEQKGMFHLEIIGNIAMRTLQAQVFLCYNGILPGS